MGAPSISSITRQLGLPPAPSTDSICVAASMRVRKASGLRSSLERQGQDESYREQPASQQDAMRLPLDVTTTNLNKP